MAKTETNRTMPVSADAAGSACSSEERAAFFRQLFTRLGPAALQGNVLQRLLEVNPRESEIIIAILKESPSLAARVLGVANSVATGMAHSVHSIDRAVVLLGGRRARSVAIAHGLRLFAEKLDLPPHLVRTLWSNAFRKAVAARRFCEMFDSEQADTAYTIALISDIGLPLLIDHDPDFYAQADLGGESVSLSERECAHFGFDHAAVGDALLTNWGVAQRLRSEMLQHHLPPRDEEIDGPEQWSILRLSVFFSGLLPHLHESPGLREEEWIRAIHARFLYPRYASPDAFLSVVATEVTGAGEAEGANEETGREDLTRNLIHEVSGDNLELVANLCRLENLVAAGQQDVEDLRSKAFTDGLTKLLNRRGLLTLLERRLLTAAEARLGVFCALCDIDDFKVVNDTHGHAAGDQVLRGLAKLLRAAAPRTSLIARLGGDEFAIFSLGLSENEAGQAAERLSERLRNQKLRLTPTVEVTLKASIGAVFYPAVSSAFTSNDLLAGADQAMYQRKHNGKGGLVFISSEGVEDHPRH